MLLIGVLDLPVQGDEICLEDGGHRSFDDWSSWEASLDDIGHVYVPSEGLAGVEVSGGNAHLKAGETDGWIASEVISAPEGYRYDMVLLDLSVPGQSRVEVSILNASTFPSQVGFANDTIIGFELLSVDPSTPYLSIYSIDCMKYPKIRIQVNLYASGADRPELLAWRLDFVDQETWCDSFWNQERMERTRGLNLTQGGLEVNLSMRRSSGGGAGLYEPYPTIAAADYDNMYLCLYYPNSAHDGYQNCVVESDVNTYYNRFADFDGDGDLDLLTAPYNGGVAQILWTGSDGKLSTTGTTDFPSLNYYSVEAGDFNNDGWQDILMSGQGGSKVFLNKGEGVFSSEGDITISSSVGDACVGDFNNDGIDDIFIKAYSSGLSCFFGGPSGPDTVADINIAYGDNDGMIAADVDEDGFLDLVMRGGYQTNVKVYLGGPDGPDGTVDYTVENSDAILGASCGDMNGDGYWEVVNHRYSSGNHKLQVHIGSASGWSTSDIHEVGVPSGQGDLSMADINADGYSDLVYTCWNPGVMSNVLMIFLGGTTWPTDHDLMKQGAAYNRHAVAIPRGVGALSYAGSFTTNDIDLPIAQGKRWDILHMDGTTPQNTSMKLSVLDVGGKVIPGYDELTDWTVDLSGLDPFQYRTIKVKVTMRSEFNNTTPTMDYIMVKWMDSMTWRDEFYGPVRVEGTANMEVADGLLRTTGPGGEGPQLVFTSILGDNNYTTTPLTFYDSGGLDYLSKPPTSLDIRGTSAVDVADVNGDGYPDVAFAVHRKAQGVYRAMSPLYLGSAIGTRGGVYHGFPTTGATDVIIRDLNDDGFTDVVFAQEYDGATYEVDSILFWGSADGWADEPDIAFATRGASGVVSSDLDDDGLLDLAFACYRDDFTASIDSLVFLQDSTGFCGTTPSYNLATKGARAVAVGDLDEDGHDDLAFGNHLAGGMTELNSYVYWGNGDGFDATPEKLPTVGATDVEMVDLDNDGHLDLVFANSFNNAQNLHVDSYVYLNDGSGEFGPAPDARLPTVGASAVAVADIDGNGWKDLVFACERDGTTCSVDSMVYLGTSSGYSSTPDILLPTEGASNVVITRIVDHGSAGYLSRPIVVDPNAVGAFDTFMYDATIGSGVSGKVHLADRDTWEVLAVTDLASGHTEWPLAGLLSVKAHPSIRVLVTVDGLNAGTIELDNLWMNWTKRVKLPPRVVSLSVSEASVLRLQSVNLRIVVADEFDLPSELTLNVEHCLNGTGIWSKHLLGSPVYSDAEGAWIYTITPKVYAAVGVYDFRVDLTDTDMLYVDNVEFPAVLEVMNNLPSTPVVHLEPLAPSTSSQLRVEFDTRSMDVETPDVEYRYLWYKDGELMTDLTGDLVPSFHTTKGQNWSVEVRAWDGDDESSPAFAWVLIGNAAPLADLDLPDPVIDEDSVDSDWLDLSTAFKDADEDPLTWSLKETVDHLEVTIDPTTGKVTLAPEADWSGEVELTFVATDGEESAVQRVTVTVNPVNDLPVITSVDGKPVTTDTLTYTIKQGDTLVITYDVADVEEDPVLATVNTTVVSFDEASRTITFEPGNDAVGTLRFALWVSDDPLNPKQVVLDFVIVVENENDPMGEPSITKPRNNDRIKVNERFTLVGVCDDPDIVWGQVLNFSWSSNMSGLLGYGPSLSVAIRDAGTHVITLTVTDGEFQRTATVTVEIEPIEDIIPPDGGGDEDGEGLNYGLIAVGIIVALVAVGAVFYVLSTRRKAEELEAEDEEEYKREHMERAYQAVKDAVDHLEKGGEAPPAKEVPSKEVAVEAAPSAGLTMEARETVAASAQTMALFGAEAEPVISEEEQEQLRLDNLKRKYQNAIGRLPYGIPSKELADREWVELAAALATGEKKETPDGRELTEIDGRWYYSDVKDTGTFLKEHGAKKEERPEPKKAVEPTTDKAALLVKLEERFILGEISEEAYYELKKKYE